MTKKVKAGLLLLVWGIALLQTVINLRERGSLHMRGAFREKPYRAEKTVEMREKDIRK